VRPAGIARRLCAASGPFTAHRPRSLETNGHDSIPQRQVAAGAANSHEECGRASRSAARCPALLAAALLVALAAAPAAGAPAVQDPGTAQPDSAAVPPTLHIDILHIVLNLVEPGVYQAIQVMNVINVGEEPARAGPAVGELRAGMIIPVPTGALEIAPVTGFAGLATIELAMEGGQLLDLQPVPPGTHQVAVQYTLFVAEEGSDFEITLPYPTAEVSLLVGPGLESTRVESAQMAELEPQQISGRGVYASWRSDVLAPGDALRFRLGPERPALSVEAWALLGLAAALFAGAAASLWGSRRLPDPEARGRLIAEIAALDDAHAAGGIADNDYYARRSEAIGRLLRIEPRPDARQDAPGE